MKYFSAREIADLFGAADRHTDVDRIQMQLRALAAKGLLANVPEIYGPKGALLYPRAELYRARVLLAAVDLGITKHNLAKLDTQLQYKLAEAVAGIDREQWWVFEVTSIRLFETGELGVSCIWVCNGERGGRADPIAKPAPDFVTDSLAGTIEAVVSIPFTALVTPLHKILVA